MKRLLNATLLAMLFSFVAESQDVIVNVSGLLNGVSTELDSVLIENITREGAFVLKDLPALETYPVNLSNQTLQSSVKLEEITTDKAVYALKNSPGELILYSASSDPFSITIHTVAGVKISTYSVTSSIPDQTIKIELPNRCIYLVSFVQGHVLRSFKALGSETKQHMVVSAVDFSSEAMVVNEVVKTKSVSGMVFQVGDEVNLTIYKSGYWAENYTLKLSATQDVQLHFIDANAIDKVMDVNGNLYRTIKIGDRWWMAENLRATNYADNSAIPHVILSSSWKVLGNNNTDKAYTWYDGNTDVENYTAGALYTFAAAVNGTPEDGTGNVQGVCPDGWHLPSDAEWTIMTDYLSNNGYNYDGSIGWGLGRIAKSMGSVNGWKSANDAGSPGNRSYINNASGFSAVPTGLIWNGEFGVKTYQGGWWSSTQVTQLQEQAFHRTIYYADPALRGGYFPKSTGLSVRCVKD